MKQRIAILIINLLGAFAIQAAPASGIDFNTDLLDVADRENIDFEQFTHVGYIVPGKYTMQVNINDRSLGEREITVKSDADGASISCIPKTLLEEFGLKESALQKVLQANTDMQCINLDVLEGSTLRPDISSYTLTISIPQTNLEYIDDNWEPISRWDNGINGFMLDYGINLQHATSSEQWENNTNASAYGVLGANYGAWRVRADWQAQYQSNRGWHTQKPPQDEDQQDQDEPQDPTHPKQVKETHQQHSADVTRVYAYRPLPFREEKLMVGELDLGNSIFDSFRFTGLTLASDDNMLPPQPAWLCPPKWSVSPKPTPRWSSARGGRVLYETQVAAGPFRIQDLNSATSGELDVRVEEQDGSLQTFKVNTAAIPYLSRPGSVRYKFASGKPSNLDHSLEGPLFVSGEASWGGQQWLVPLRRRPGERRLCRANCGYGPGPAAIWCHLVRHDGVAGRIARERNQARRLLSGQLLQKLRQIRQPGGVCRLPLLGARLHDHERLSERQRREPGLLPGGARKRCTRSF